MTETNNGWISVKDRLPERNKDVLVYAVGKAEGFIGKAVITIAAIVRFRVYSDSPGYWDWSVPWQYFFADYEITHWMPLPEPPKMEDEK